VVVLLKITALKSEDWMAKDLAISLTISASEVSESLNRSKIAGLVSADKKLLFKKNLLDFLEYSIRLVYPAEPGTNQWGMVTAHSATPLNRIITTDDIYVWPLAQGKQRGQAIPPMHPGVP
jgi:hypothetical protein